MTDDRLLERLLTLEERRLALEERDHSSSARDRRSEFIKANLAAILAFLTSIASLAIAYRAQKINESGERERQQTEQKRLELEIQKSIADTYDSDRRWHLALLDFTAANRDLVFGSDEVAKKRISQIMLVTFPAELVLPLFEKLEKVSPETTAWKQGATKAAEIAKSQPRRQNLIAMRSAGLFMKLPGTTVTLRTESPTEITTYVAFLKSATAAGSSVVATWSSTQLESAGGSFVVEPNTSYTVSITAVPASPSARLNATLTFSDAEPVETTIALGDGFPIAWRILASDPRASMAPQ